jgi:adenosylmethionine-8-amino-7-oxononanoate aminotransferase
MLDIDLVTGRATKTPLNGASKAVFKGCLVRGVIARPTGSRIILSPPLVSDRTACDTIIAAITAATQDYRTGANHA